MYRSFKTRMNNIDGPAEVLRKISSWMFENTYKIFKIGNDGWSIEMAVLDTYERTLYKLQRMLVIKKVHPTSKIRNMIEKMIQPWEIRIERECKHEGDKEYLGSLTGIKPNDWRNISSGETALNLIIMQLKITHRLNQGKKRSQRIDEIQKKGE